MKDSFEFRRVILTQTTYGSLWRLSRALRNLIKICLQKAGVYKLLTKLNSVLS